MLLVAPARELLRFVPLLVVLLFVGRADDSGPPWGLIGAAVVIALGLARYLSTRFRITSAAVEIRTGLVTRRTSTVPRQRIRSVDVSADPLHRLLRLVRLQIGTGTSGERHEESLVLDGLRADEATALRTELLHRAPGATPAGHSGDARGRGQAAHRRPPRHRRDRRGARPAQPSLDLVRAADPVRRGHRRGPHRPALAPAERSAGEPRPGSTSSPISSTTSAEPRSGSTSSESLSPSSCSSRCCPSGGTSSRSGVSG